METIIETDNMTNRISLALVLALWAAVASPGATAQDQAHIGEFTYYDRQYMKDQRAALDDLAARNFGRAFNGNKNSDLEILQALLDKRLVRPDQTRELQAMGVIMGDLLATELGMHWVIYEDRMGRSRALRYKESANYLFPMTMISMRREADNSTPVAEIYQKAYNIIAAEMPALPFQ